MTNKVYEDIKANMPEKIHLDIMSILQFHVGEENSISKDQLSDMIFGKCNVTVDRQIRDAVADLVVVLEKPIVTNTRTGGYYIASTPEEIDENIADLHARIAHLQLRIDGLRRAKQKTFFKGQKDSNEMQDRLFDIPWKKLPIDTPRKKL